MPTEFAQCPQCGAYIVRLRADLHETVIWCERCHADFLLLLANRTPAEAWRAYIVQVGRQVIATERGTLALLERMGDGDADR